MKLTILAVGKARKSPEATLWEDWLKRCPFPATLKEYDPRLPAGPARTEEESRRLLSFFEQAQGSSKRLIGLDPNGTTISSEEFSQLIGDWRADGVAHCFFAVGGADGHHQDLLNACDKLISFGRMTWPHMLCRAMLAEQLYRAEMILARHPYHRA
ncbi:MAG: 23S rRNA (pseudouridine(1915)-N(3))-methyltransferase RlmH [Pseudomonadota bacterium]|nr:23S rRNA (pseudouridine(1915)-N(3))-methyltransferase RlmH [Pseudomonadota bacterium]